MAYQTFCCVKVAVKRLRVGNQSTWKLGGFGVRDLQCVSFMGAVVLRDCAALVLYCVWVEANGGRS